MKSEHGEHEWEKNKWYKTKGKLEMCENGFHASEYIQDALNYVQGNTLAEVETKGKILKQDDKICSREMRITKTYNWDKIKSLKLAIFSAELSINNWKEYSDDDSVLKECIKITKEILDVLEKGETPTKEQISAARSAEAAAQAAAGSAARAAARAAAWSTRSAAWAAAWSAEADARSAARSAADSSQEKVLLKMITNKYGEIE